MPASSREPQKAKHKVYSVRRGSGSRVADFDAPTLGYHKRKDSSGQERNSYQWPVGEKGRTARYYRHVPHRSRAKSIEDDAYSHAPAGMYRDTEPLSRVHEVRPQRRSVDQGGAATNRERPVSVNDLPLDSREYGRDVGPPPSTRGWAAVNELGRSRTTKERAPQHGLTSSYSRPRVSSFDHPISSERYDTFDQDDRYREPRGRERPESPTRTGDPSVERRGFGIRPGSQVFAPPEPHRRDFPLESSYHDDWRLEQEKSDRLLAEQLQADEREREPREKDVRRREDGHIYDRTFDRGRDRSHETERDPNSDRERERERERAVEQQPPPASHQERHQSRRDTDFRDDGSGLRSRDFSEAATAGLAGAAAGSAFAFKESTDLQSTSGGPSRPGDADEDYRHRMEKVQRELGLVPGLDRQEESDPDRERRRREREERRRSRHSTRARDDSISGEFGSGGSVSSHEQEPGDRRRESRSFEKPTGEGSLRPPGLTRKPSVLDEPMMKNKTAVIMDNSRSDYRENRVRIVDPPTEETDRRPKGILKKPTEKFPEDQHGVREGVAPLKDVRWPLGNPFRLVRLRVC